VTRPDGRDERRAIAGETVRIVGAGFYLARSGHRVVIADAVRAAVAGTRHHPPHEDLAAPGGRARTPVVEVTDESTLVAARRLGESAAGLVFASATKPGGGFLNGAEAQEESIARASALHACQLAAPDFYAHHRRERNPMYSDRMIYSPAVPVFRDDGGHLLDRPFGTGLLTAAAPNLGAIRQDRPEHADGVPAVIRRRARRVLAVAASHGHRSLVLEAWGCGVFGNEPDVVAAAFAEALTEPDCFDHVVFAIRGGRRAAEIRSVFAALCLRAHK
jgi:uncharacterized protein (TIGR02452 family)